MSDDRRSWQRAALAWCGLHLLIAGSMSAFMVGGRWTWTELLITLGANLTFSICIGTITTFVYSRLLPRFEVTGWRKAALHALGFAISVALGVELALLLLGLFSVHLDGSRAMVWRFAGVVTLVVLLVTLAFDRLREHARAVELREEQASRQLVQAQLENLRARLNPHFLFNSLNTLAGLIEEDPERAVQALTRLSELMRHALESTTTRRATLGAELDLLEDYLRMEQLRFGDRLRWTLDADPALRSSAVPSLLLQPVVENAVKYAVAPRRDGGSIDIAARLRGDRLLLAVDDDGPGHAHSSGTGVGEATLRQRLALEYGDDATLQAGPSPTGGYTVAIELPLEDASA